MRRSLALRRSVGTLLALGAAWAIWRGSADVAELLNWPDLLPLVRLGAVVVGVSLLDWIFTVLRPVFSGGVGKSNGS